MRYLLLILVLFIISCDSQDNVIGYSLDRSLPQTYFDNDKIFYQDGLYYYYVSRDTLLLSPDMINWEMMWINRN